MKKTYLLTFCLLLAACGQATQIPPTPQEPTPQEPTPPPADTQVPPTETPEPVATVFDFPFSSQKLEDDLTIQIALPAGYEESPDVEYDSIYLLDANYFFTATGTLDYLMTVRGAGMAQIVQDLIRDEKIPPSILIGIGYTEAQRSRFTMGSKVEAFYEFFTDELIPEIESRFRVSTSAQDRLLFGYSGSAQFSTYVLIHEASTETETFNKFISISGVYDRYQVLYRPAEAIFQGSDTDVFAGKSLFIAVGTDDPKTQLVNAHRAFTEELASREYADFRLYHTEFEGKGHYDLPEFAFAEAMIWMFGE